MTISFENSQRGFACAEEPLDAAYLDVLLRKRAARLAGLFLKCFGRRLAESSVGLVEMLEQLTTESFEVGWSSALGHLRLALLTKPLDAHRALVAATSMALHVAEKGAAVRIEVTFDRPEAFRFGHLQLAASPTLSFESDWESAQHPPPAGELIRVETPSRPVLLASALPHGAVLPEGLVAASAEHEALRQRYEDAYAVLVECAHPYREWVERAIEMVIPVETTPGATTSSSFEHFPGVIALSHDSPAISMADALVHEASHQHFYILTQLGPVHDGSDTTMYFSPAPKADRPIDKILLAYHAFANTFLFYRHARTNGFADAAFCRVQEDAYQACLVDLQRPLETTRSLTPLGRALFEPLAHRISCHVT